MFRTYHLDYYKFVLLPSDTRVAHLALTVRPSPSPTSTPAHASCLDQMDFVDMAFVEVIPILIAVAFYLRYVQTRQAVYVI